MRGIGEEFGLAVESKDKSMTQVKLASKSHNRFIDSNPSWDRNLSASISSRSIEISLRWLSKAVRSNEGSSSGGRSFSGFEGMKMFSSSLISGVSGGRLVASLARRKRFFSSK